MLFKPAVLDSLAIQALVALKREASNALDLPNWRIQRGTYTVTVYDKYLLAKEQTGSRYMGHITHLKKKKPTNS